KRPRLRQRAAKWARRHKPVVVSAVCLLAVTVVGLSVGSFLLWHAYDDATTQSQKKTKNFQLALEALDKVYLQVAEKQLPQKPRLEQSDRELLEQVLSFYERFAQENGEEPSAWRHVARASTRVGDISFTLGRAGAAA